MGSKNYNLQVEIEAKDNLSAAIKGLERLLELKKELTGQFSTVSDSDIKKIVEMLAEQDKLTASIKKQKTVVSQLTAANDAEVKGKLRLQEAQRVQKAALRDEIRLQEGLGKKYDEQSKRLLALKNKYKDLYVQGKTNTVGFKELGKEINTLDAKLKKIDRSVGDGSRTVGIYEKAWTGLKNVISGLGIVLGVTALFNAFRGLKNVIFDFDDGLKSVEKTTGLAGVELSALGDDIIGLSRKLETVGTPKLLQYATVAGQLGVKGSKNILAFSEALAKLETASDITGEAGGASIARLLTLTDGGVENVGDFGDEIVALGNNFAATEAEILSNATAIAQNTGVYKLARQQVLAYATATKAVGLESELTGTTVGKTLGLLEKALRTGKNVSVISQLTGKSVEELKKQFREDSGSVFTDLVKGLNNVDKSGGSVNAQLEKLGITAVRDQRVIASLATAGFGTLSKALTDVASASGSLDKEFGTASEKLKNQWATAKIAFDNFILSIDKGDGILGSALQTIAGVTRELISLATGSAKAKSELTAAQFRVRIIAENFVALGKALGVVLTAFVSYKVAIIASTSATRAHTIATSLFATAKGVLTGKINLATISMRAFNNVSKANIIGVVTSLIVAAAGAYFAFGRKVAGATAEQKAFNEAQKETQALLDNVKDIEKTAKQLDSLSREQLENLRGRIREQINSENDRVLAFRKANEGLFKSIEEGQNKSNERQINAGREALRVQLGQQLGLVDRFGRAREATEVELTEFLNNENRKRLENLEQIVEKKIAAIKEPAKIEKELSEKEKRELRARNKEARDQAEAELKFIKDTINEGQERVEAEKRMHNERLANAGIFGRQRKDLTATELQALEVLEKQHAENLRKIEADNLKTLNELQETQVENKILSLDKKEIKAKRELEAELLRIKIENIEQERDLALKSVKEGSDEEFLIKAQAEQKILELKRQAADEAERINREHLDRIIRGTDYAAERIADAFDKSARKNEERINKEISDQDKALQFQQARAERGLSNEVELQQRKAAELEVEKQKQQAKEERRQKILTFYNLFSNYAKTEPKTALANAIRDMAIGEGIAAAFAEKGGIVGDVKDSVSIGNGLSKSHGNSMDRLVVADKREGILTAKQMSHLGRDGFYNLQNMLNNPMNDDIMFPKVPVFAPMPVANSNKELVREIRELKSIIKDKPVSNSRLDNVGNVISETVESGVKHTLKIISNKPRFRR